MHSPRTYFYLAASLGLTLMTAHFAVASDKEEFDVPPQRGVTADGDVAKRLGVTTAQMRETQFRAEARGLGVVVSVDVLAQAEAELRTAESAAQASQSAQTRARNLYNADTAVSRQVMEAAEHQAITDTAALALAQRKAAAVWGRKVPWQDAAQRAALLAKLASGEDVLVRVTVPNAGQGEGIPSPLRLQRLDVAKEGQTWTASKVWAAPADPTIPGRSFFALVENAQDLAEGEHLRVVGVNGEAKQGVIVPASAVLLADGQTWCYVAEKADYFARQLVDLSQPTEGGYFVSTGIMPGETVVVRGAGQLLSLEAGAGAKE